MLLGQSSVEIECHENWIFFANAGFIIYTHLSKDLCNKQLCKNEIHGIVLICSISFSALADSFRAAVPVTQVMVCDEVVWDLWSTRAH